MARHKAELCQGWDNSQLPKGAPEGAPHSPLQQGGRRREEGFPGAAVGLPQLWCRGRGMDELALLPHPRFGGASLFQEGGPRGPDSLASDTAGRVRGLLGSWGWSVSCLPPALPHALTQQAHGPGVPRLACQGLPIWPGPSQAAVPCQAGAEHLHRVPHTSSAHWLWPLWVSGQQAMGTCGASPEALCEPPSPQPSAYTASASQENL